MVVNEQQYGTAVPLVHRIICPLEPARGGGGAAAATPRQA